MSVHKIVCIVDRRRGDYLAFWRIEADKGQAIPRDGYCFRVVYHKDAIEQLRAILIRVKRDFLYDEYEVTRRRKERVTRTGIKAMREYFRNKKRLEKLRNSTITLGI